MSKLLCGQKLLAVSYVTVTNIRLLGARPFSLVIESKTMAFIYPSILLFTGVLAFLYARKKRHILLTILFFPLAIIFGSFFGFSLGWFLGFLVEDQTVSKELALNASTTGFTFSVVGVIVGFIFGRKYRK